MTNAVQRIRRREIRRLVDRIEANAMETWHFGGALNDRYNFRRWAGGGHFRRSKAFSQRREVKNSQR